MKVSVVCLLVLVAVAYVCASPEDKYTTKYDNIDVDQILNSDRLLMNYYKCLLDEGRCTPEGVELKRILPEALATDCQKCSAKHREVTTKVVKHLVEKKPDLWKKLADKYDPDRKYRSKYEDEAKKHGITV